MLDVLRISASVGTPLALLGLVAALAYFAYTRRLKYDEKKLEALPPNQRATRTDEYLTRYGIDGKKLALADKLALIKDELEKRHQRSLGYVVVAAVVFVVCFGLAVLAYVIRQDPAPPPPSQTTFRVIDALTTDPVHRPLNATYTQKPVTQNSAGEITLEAELANIDLNSLQIVCPGYRFVASQQAQLHKGIITLQRVPEGEPNHFSAAITPALDAIPWVSLAHYQAAVKDQVTGDGVKLRCVNSSPYHVNLVLYQWIPPTALAPSGGFSPGWMVPAVAAPCPPKSAEGKTYRIQDFHQGVYYYIFGSICGLQATPLTSGNLHGPPAPVLEVFVDEAASSRTNPKLVGRLVFGDFE